jgi:hypothetical protein
MSVPLAPGHYEIRFARKAGERIAFAVSFLSWAGVAAWGIGNARKRAS